MSDVLERLQGYNPPDRTVDVDRQIAQDIADAASEITALRARAEELTARHARCVSACRDLADFTEYCYTEKKLLRGPYARQAVDLVTKADAALAAEGE